MDVVETGTWSCKGMPEKTRGLLGHDVSSDGWGELIGPDMSQRQATENLLVRPGI